MIVFLLARIAILPYLTTNCQIISILRLWQFFVFRIYLPYNCHKKAIFRRFRGKKTGSIEQKYLFSVRYLAISIAFFVVFGSMHGESHSFSVMSLTKPLKLRPDAASDTSRRNNRRVTMQCKLRRDAFSATSYHHQVSLFWISSKPLLDFK